MAETWLSTKHGGKNCGRGLAEMDEITSWRQPVNAFSCSNIFRVSTLHMID